MIKFEEFLTDIFSKNDLDELTFKQWISNPKTTLETMIKPADEFVSYLSSKIYDLLPHAYIAQQQSKFSRELKDRLGNGEFQVIIDYAENYAFQVQEAVPGFHWNNDQATVYNVVIYYRENESTNHRSLVIISDCLLHDAVSVYTFQKLIIQFLTTEFSTVNKIFYFSDGAPQQFKNYKNVLNLAHHIIDFNVSAEWHFYPTAHGKGPCDGLGATVKRAAMRESLQSPLNNHILTPIDLFNWLSATDRLPNVSFKFSPVKDYKASERFLNQRFKSSSRVPHIKDQHCLIPLRGGIIRAKTHSDSMNYEDFQIL